MIGKGVRERSLRRQRENILFLTHSLLVFSFDLGSVFTWLYPSPAHAQTERNFQYSICETAPKLLFWAPTCISGYEVVQDHNWPVQKAIVNLPIRLEGNSKHISSNLLSPLGSQNKDLIGLLHSRYSQPNRGQLTST